MKKLSLILTLMAGLAFAAMPLAMLPGCASPTQQKMAVTTLASTHDAVDAAYKSYISAVLDGVVQTNNVPQVSEAYREFQSAFALAILAVNNNTNAAVPQSVFDAQAKLFTLIPKVK